MIEHRSLHAGSALSSLIALALLGTSAVLTSSTASFAQAPDLPVIGIPVQAAPSEAVSVNLDAFIEGMAELGYHDGLNVRYEVRYGDGSGASGNRVNAEIVALEPDVILVGGSGPLRRIAALTSTIPIVAARATDALVELVQNHDQPEGNITGRMDPVITAASDLEWINDFVPDMTKVGFLYDAVGDVELMQEATEAAAAAGYTIVFQGWGATVEDAVAGYKALVAQDVDVIDMWASVPTADDAMPQIIAAAKEAGIPTFGFNPDAVAEGGLASMEADQVGHWHIASYFVDRLLQGATVADLPVLESPPSLVWSRINVKTARELGLTVPDSILNRAEIFGN